MRIVIERSETVDISGLQSPRRKQDDNIKIYLKETGFEDWGLHSFGTAQPPASGEITACMIVNQQTPCGYTTQN
jgi:hypothetical protein